jgi:ubiquinone/menaquinone biosynthesis C-methylase UbiE
MLRPRRLAAAQERLDQPGHDPMVLANDLDIIASVNRWLGGTRAILRTLQPLLPAGAVHVLDVGTGSADIPRALVRWGRKTGRLVRVVATELHPQTIAIARERTRSDPAINCVRANVLRLPYADRAFDVALLSLTFHHIEDHLQTTALQELVRVSRRAVIVNELVRSWPNYLGARVLATTLWGRNSLAAYDGPISVLRGFTAAELAAAAHQAGFSNARVARRFFQRLVLVISLQR